MQRLRLYTSGVKVPPLGSPQDRVLRRFMTWESLREIEKNALIAQIAMASGHSKDWGSIITSKWSAYVSRELGMVHQDTDQAVQRTEEQMMQDYEKIRQLRPKLIVGRDGSLSVKGLS